MMPSPSGSTDAQPSLGSGGRPSSFSLRHLSVPSSGTPSPSASGFGPSLIGGGLGGSGGRHPDAVNATTRQTTAAHQVTRCPFLDQSARWVSMEMALSRRSTSRAMPTDAISTGEDVIEFRPMSQDGGPASL